MQYFVLLFCLFFAYCKDKNDLSEYNTGNLPSNEIIENFTSLVTGPDTLSDDFLYRTFNSSMSKLSGEGKLLLLEKTGDYYYKKEKPDSALKYLKKGLELSKSLNNRYFQCVFHLLTGQTYTFISEFDHALEELTRAYDLSISLDSTDLIINTSLNLGNAYLGLGLYDKARDYFNESFKNALETGDKTGMATSCLGLAESYIIGNDLNKVEPYLSKGFELSKEIGSLQLFDISYRLYSDYYSKKGEYKTAHKYLSLDLSIKDSVNSLQNAANVARHDNQYKVTQKELEIIRLKEKQKNYIEFLVLGLITFIITSIIVFTSYRQKIKTNKILSRKNLEILNSKNELEEQHKVLLVSQEKLKKIDEGKDDFLSVISHDLKNPLSAIRGFMELMIRSYDELSDEQKKKFLKEIFYSVERLGLLINNILLWVKSQAKGINIQAVEFNPGKRINDNIAIYSITAAEKEIKINNMVNPDLRILTDLNIFDMIIRNLLSNALKFTDKKGIILISAEKAGKMVRFSIKDNGIGIPQDKIELILDQQKNYSTIGTFHEQGTGLGLGLVTEFMHKIGGRFYIFSQPGQGTTVVFEFPSAG